MEGEEIVLRKRPLSLTVSTLDGSTELPVYSRIINILL